jgi:hypothetical protein
VFFGGTHPFRDNNPGDLRSGHGSIGRDGGFAIYSSLDSGVNALGATLTGKYGDSTISDTMKAFAPAGDGNDPVKYAGGWPRSRRSFQIKMRVPPVPRCWEPGLMFDEEPGAPPYVTKAWVPRPNLLGREGMHWAGPHLGRTSTCSRLCTRRNRDSGIPGERASSIREPLSKSRF